MFSRYVITRTAYEDVKNLDRATKQRLKDRLEDLLILDNPLASAEKLKDKRAGSYVWRIGDFRVVFDVVSREKIVILRIQNRKEIYKRQQG